MDFGLCFRMVVVHHCKSIPKGYWDTLLLPKSSSRRGGIPVRSSSLRRSSTSRVLERVGNDNSGEIFLKVFRLVLLQKEWVVVVRVGGGKCSGIVEREALIGAVFALTGFLISTFRTVANATRQRPICR